MKKLIAKVSSVLVASAMLFALVSCGSDTADESTTGDETVAADDDSSSDATIKIGGIGPITGDAAVYGISVENGAQLAVDEINAAGGINGIQIEFQFEDDEADAEKSVNAYNSLKDWGMQMLMGTVTSGACVAVAAETAEDSMFQITPSGSSTDCITNDNAFRVCFSDPSQGTASAQYIGENELATKVAVIYNSSDIYSSGIYEAFAEEAENQGIEIVAAEAFTSDSKTDFSVQIQKAKSAGAELVFLPIYYSEASLILSQCASADYSPLFFGCDGLDGILTVENFDTSLAEGLMLLTPFVASSEDETTKSFVESYEELYGETPNQFAADGYDAIYIIKAAAEQAGITADMSVEEICEAMKTAMTEITVSGVTSSSMTWTADGEPDKAPKAMVIEDGEYAAM